MVTSVKQPVSRKIAREGMLPQPCIKPAIMSQIGLAQSDQAWRKCR